MSTSFQDKLFHYAPEPPQKAWEAIEEALEQGTLPSLSQKLSEFEASPPADAWQKIEASLDNGKERLVRIIPFSKKYAAAAVVAGLIILSSVLFFANRHEPLPLTTTAGSVPVLGAAEPSLPSKGSAVAGENVTGEETARTEKNEAGTIVYTPRQRDLQINNPEEDQGMIAASFIPQRAEARRTISQQIPVDKYMVYSDGDGNAVKLSKKIFDLIACVKEDLLCKQRLQKMQEKFAASSLSSDFTGVLETLHNLRENQ